MATAPVAFPFSRPFHSSKGTYTSCTATGIVGPHWSGKIIQFKTDNMGVIQVIEATYAQYAHLMHLICLLVFYVSYYNFWFTVTYIPRVADALPWNNMPVFHSQESQVSGAAKDPIQICSNLSYTNISVDNAQDPLLYPSYSNIQKLIK